MNHAEKIWNRFCESQSLLATRDEDYQSWRRGRDRYFVWVLSITNPLIEQRARTIQGAMHDVLLSKYQRRLHITLFVCGFAVQQTTYDDDMSCDAILAQIDHLEAQPLAITKIRIGILNSFESAPFLEVLPDQTLLNLRQLLVQSHREVRFEQWAPHVTLGLYKTEMLPDNVFQEMKRFRRLPEIPVTIDGVELMSFDARKVGGSLRCEYRIDFV